MPNAVRRPNEWRVVSHIQEKPLTTSSQLQVGRDVPWVTSWSDENLTGVARCPSVDGELAIGQRHNPGVGLPLYSKNHLFRQRKSVREMLCPMCGKPTSDGDRWSQTATSTTAGIMRNRGFAWALPSTMSDDQALLNCGAIAPLHRACGEAALVSCPHLNGMKERELKPFPSAWIVIPLWQEAKSGGPSPRSAPVVSFLQLVGVESP